VNKQLTTQSSTAAVGRTDLNHDRRVQFVKILIEDNFHLRLDLTDMARAVNLSPWRLAHLFKAEVGISPLRYLTLIRLKDGRSITAVDLQREFLALAHRYYRDREAEPWVREVMTRWESTLDRLAEDPMQLGRELDWVIKRQLIENYMAKHDLEWNDSRVQMIDLQFHDIRPGKGLFYKLEESDAVDRIATDDEIAKAIYDPPKDTRAYFRGMCLQRYADEIVSASWDSVIFDLKEGPLKKIFMLEPLRGTEAHVRQLLTESPTAADLLRNIARPSYGM